MTILIPIILIIICCLIIWKASDGFEAASEYLGRNLNDGVRGATINAIGSSMPELFTTFCFLFLCKDTDGFASGIGTTAGSAIFNGVIIPAVVILAVIGFGLAKRVTVSKKVIWRDGLSLIIAEIILISLISGDTLQWWHGLILMLVYVVYVVYMLTTMRKNTEEEIEENESSDDEDDETNENPSLIKSILTLDLESIFVRGSINSSSAWILLIAAMAVIGGACLLLVHACEDLGVGLGIHTYFIAVVLASAATSVPDTIISYRDAMNGEYDDAVANALGSNIFDVCFALGLPLLVFTLVNGPIVMAPETVGNITELRVILLIATIIAFLIFVIGKGMGRLKAVLLLCIYIAFTVFISCKAYDCEWAIDLGNLLKSLIS